MKKNLYWLSAVALLASCSDEMLENAPASKVQLGQGVSFEIVNDLETRGMVDSDYSSFFFAEQDRVNIFADNALNNANAAVDGYTNPVVYKATASKGNPCLTAIDDANLLNLKADDGDSRTDETARFLVAYPTDQTVKYDQTKKTFTITPGVSLDEQNMDGYMNFDGRLLYQYTTALKKNFYDAVGEKVELHLTSPLYMVRPSMTDIETYSEQFGKLKSVEFSSAKTPLIPGVEGMETIVTESDVVIIGGKTYLISSVKYDYPALTAGDVVVIDGISYIKSTCTYDEDNDVYYLGTKSKRGTVGGPNTAAAKVYSLYKDGDENHDKEVKVGDSLGKIAKDDVFVLDQTTNTVKYVKNDEGTVNKATLKISENTEIKNGTEMNLFVLPQIHNGEAENYVVTYKFDNVWLRYTKAITADMNAGGTGALKLTIADEFPYIVTMGKGGVSRSLIVNSGNVKSILNADEKSVKWTDEYDTDGTVEFSDITDVLINANVADLTAADWAALNKLTATTKLTILNGTEKLGNISALAALEELKADNIVEVPAPTKPATKQINAASIKKLSLASVTSYNDPTPYVVLTDLNIGSYTFEDDNTALLFFNDKTQQTLVNVDIHSCTSLAPVFGYQRNILFTDYEKLETIKLNAEKTVISASEFKGCVSLKTVEGVVEMSTATSAFEGCSKLSKVNIYDTEIPARAFAKSTVKDVLQNGKQVVPTYIGESAFEKNTAIKALDLTQIEGKNLAKAAFNGATSFAGIGNNGVVTLNVTEVPVDAFNGTAVLRFQLKKATKTAAGSLNSSALLQIKYRQSPTYISNTQVDVVKKASVDIFVKSVADAPMFEGYRTITKEDFDWE